MKLSMIAIGSRGDVQPIVALAYLRVQYIALSKKSLELILCRFFPYSSRWVVGITA